nr:MAG TPA: baseplate protein [Caudoviricetes sp.]
MFKKIKDWLGTNLDVYKVEKADDVGAGLVRHKWQGEQTATQIGTTLTSDILNNFQKGLIPFVETVRTTGTDKDIYTVSVNGLKEFGLFDGLKLLLRIDNENQYNNSVININDSEYPLYSVKNGANEAVKKGSLRTKGYYFITYNQNAFYLNAGNVLGTEADTALEGKRLAEIIGLEFGGNIQDTGAKVTGKFYYDKALKYYYECIVNNSLTYNDGSKFRAISNKPLSDRLENLYEIENQRIQVANGDVIFTKKGKTVTVMVRLQNDGNNITFHENQQLLEIPTKFRPTSQSYGFEAALASSSLTPGFNGATRMQINPTNITIWGAHLGRFNVLKGSATYFID